MYSIPQLWANGRACFVFSETSGPRYFTCPYSNPYTPVVPATHQSRGAQTMMPPITRSLPSLAQSWSTGWGARALSDLRGQDPHQILVAPAVREWPIYARLLPHMQKGSVSGLFLARKSAARNRERLDLSTLPNGHGSLSQLLATWNVTTCTNSQFLENTVASDGVWLGPSMMASLSTPSNARDGCYSMMTNEFHQILKH